jgi:hypothetical protein
MGILESHPGNAPPEPAFGISCGASNRLIGSPPFSPNEPGNLCAASADRQLAPCRDVKNA